MKIIIAGGTGFIGQATVPYFLNKGYQCVVVSRSKNKVKKIFDDSVKAVTWEELANSSNHDIKTADLIINLTGENIGAKRWTAARKEELVNSRVIPTRILAEFCAELGKNSPPLFNAGGVGIYGLQPASPQGLPPGMDERTPLNYDHPSSFLETIGQLWEQATQPAKDAGVRVVNMRFGVVLGKHGGVLKQLQLPFNLFIGGPIGNGQQPFSWVALADLLRAIEFLFEHPKITGPVNIVSPKCVTQKEFAKALGNALHRPSFVKTPAFILELIFGQMAKELLLSGQHVYPKILLEYGFEFHFADIDIALKNLF